MKRIAVFLTLLLLASFAAQAAMELDAAYSREGMGRSWAQGYAPEEKGNTMTLHFPLRAEGVTGQLSARFRAVNQAGSPFVHAESSVRVAAQRGLYPLRFTLPLHPDRMNGLYACEIAVEGQDAAGRALTASFPLWIEIKGGQPLKEARPLEILELSLPEALRPGKTGSLALRLKNRSASQPLSGIAFTVSDASGEILPAGSDSLYVDKLMPGEEQALSLPLLALGSATARPHQLKAQLSYLSLKGERQKFSEQHTVQITHEIRLEHGAPGFPQRVRQGELNDFSLNLMNMGDGALKHVLLTVEMEGFDRQSVLVGEIPRDESRTAKAALRAGTDKLGEVAGRLLVSYEDAYGAEGSLEIPLSTVIEEKPAVKPPEEQETDEKRVEQKPLWLQILPWALVGVAVLALVVQGALLRGKMRKMEEDRL